MRRRLLITIAATAALLLVAAASLAAWLSMRETAESSFTAASATVRVNLGDAETTPLFTATDLEPGGQFVNACLRAEIDNTSTATVAKLYSGGATGTGLADYLMIAIWRENPVASGLVPGIIDCTEFTSSGSTELSLFNETLTAYASRASDYATGDSLGTLLPSAVNTVDFRIVLWLPEDTPESVGGLDATTSWIVEDQ